MLCSTVWATDWHVCLNVCSAAGHDGVASPASTTAEVDEMPMYHMDAALHAIDDAYATVTALSSVADGDDSDLDMESASVARPSAITPHVRISPK